jgi:hypothetical protein
MKIWEPTKPHRKSGMWGTGFGWEESFAGETVLVCRPYTSGGFRE